MKRFWTAIVLILALVFWGGLKAFKGNDETYLHIYHIPNGFGFGGYNIYAIEDSEGVHVILPSNLRPKPLVK